MKSFSVMLETFTEEKNINHICIYSKYMTSVYKAEDKMNLTEVNVGEEYIVKDIKADDEELIAFLFSLGCYSGEPITVVSRLKGGCVVSIKDGRYNIDNDLAEAILV